MSTAKHTELLIKKGAVPLHFITAKDAQDQDCFFYIFASESRIKQFLSASDELTNIYDYGTVVASGYGSEPSQEIKYMLKEKYGYDA